MSRSSALWSAVNVPAMRRALKFLAEQHIKSAATVYVLLTKHDIISIETLPKSAANPHKDWIIKFMANPCEVSESVNGNDPPINEICVPSETYT